MVKPWEAQEDRTWEILAPSPFQSFTPETSLVCALSVKSLRGGPCFPAVHLPSDMGGKSSVPAVNLTARSSTFLSYKHPGIWWTAASCLVSAEPGYQTVSFVFTSCSPNHLDSPVSHASGTGQCDRAIWSLMMTLSHAFLLVGVSLGQSEVYKGELCRALPKVGSPQSQ